MLSLPRYVGVENIEMKRGNPLLFLSVLIYEKGSLFRESLAGNKVVHTVVYL